MPDLDRAHAYFSRPVLTPRQDRMEAALLDVLRRQGTRSELRAVVYELAGLFRLQGIPASQAAESIKAVAARASTAMPVSGGAVGDSLSDRMALIGRWCTARYARGD
jgi:hypothetical protein